jgi:DNA-binding transcriptional ArsR family regulator
LKPYADITDPRVVKALAHPIRTQILGALDDRIASPNELSRELGVPLGSVSYHVHRLVALGFLKLVKKTPRRGAIEHYYTAVGRPQITDAAWGEVSPIVKRAMVSASLEHVAVHVNAAAAAGGFDIANAHLTRTAVRLDEEGWNALAKELEATCARVDQIAAESAERLDSSEASTALEATAVLMLFRSAPVGAPADPAASQHRPGRRPAKALARQAR